jgi:hypothetical protein
LQGTEQREKIEEGILVLAKRPPTVKESSLSPSPIPNTYILI